MIKMAQRIIGESLTSIHDPKHDAPQTEHRSRFFFGSTAGLDPLERSNRLSPMIEKLINQRMSNYTFHNYCSVR